MFFVFNKEKIYSYIIALSTVVILFMIANIIVSNTETTVLTSAVNRLVPIYNVDTEENKIAFTMNCAWNADDIDEILEILEKNNIHITFFVVGNWAEKYPEYLKKMAEAGHEIANHSNTHPHVCNLNISQNADEIQNANNTIKKITGIDTKLYRAPYGEYNNTVINSATEKGYKTIQWNIDTLDYTGITGNQMWENIEPKLNRGSIILSHNGTKHTKDSLDMIINNIKQKGYRIVKVSDLIYNSNYQIDANGMQFRID